ncbi:MAG: hypothetical protein HDP28_02170 [Clostridia bacterium]|nr:hypothetical protein [Clostridia bacterium]
MAYEKRVAVLKQVNKGFSADGSALSGAVYLERFGKELTVKVQAAGLAAVKEGRYVVVLSVGDKNFCLALGRGEPLKIADAPSIKDGFSVLISFVRDEAQPVAFGRCGSSKVSEKELLSVINSSEKKGDVPAIPVPTAPGVFPPLAPNVPGNPSVPVPGIPPKEAPNNRAPFREGAVCYDDEAIAESDYFFDRVQEGDRNENTAGKGEGKGRKKTGGSDLKKDDNSVNPFLRTKGKLTYYKKVREELEHVFQKFPKDTRLLKVFPRSEWVKTESALLGIVYENGQPRYLCVAAEKNGDPPEEMKEHCTFVPESPFSDENGFYIVFQDADSGAYVNVGEA